MSSLLLCVHEWVFVCVNVSLCVYEAVCKWLRLICSDFCFVCSGFFCMFFFSFRCFHEIEVMANLWVVGNHHVVVVIYSVQCARLLLAEHSLDNVNRVARGWFKMSIKVLTLETQLRANIAIGTNTELGHISRQEIFNLKIIILNKSLKHLGWG